DAPGRFGDEQDLRAITDPVAYINYLGSTGFLFDNTLYAILQAHIPIPPEVPIGITPDEFYGNIAYWIGYVREQRASTDAGDATYDPMVAAGLTDDIESRIVKPTLAAGGILRRAGVLTRLLTVLSPEDMTDDPVFDFNADLDQVPVDHRANEQIHC